jgi:hypothetical protein
VLDVGVGHAIDCSFDRAELPDHLIGVLVNIGLGPFGFEPFLSPLTCPLIRLMRLSSFLFSALRGYMMTSGTVVMVGNVVPRIDLNQNMTKACVLQLATNSVGDFFEKM